MLKHCLCVDGGMLCLCRCLLPVDRMGDTADRKFLEAMSQRLSHVCRSTIVIKGYPPPSSAQSIPQSAHFLLGNPTVHTSPAFLWKARQNSAAVSEAVSHQSSISSAHFSDDATSLPMSPSLCSGALSIAIWSLS